MREVSEFGRNCSIRALVLLGVVLGVAVSGCSAGGGGGDPTPTETTAAAGGEWKVGSCATPNPERPPDGYKVIDCDDGAATVEVLAITDAAILGEPECPSGTDIIIEIETFFGTDDQPGSGLPTNTACMRNLSGDHPGDPGMGGGQLLTGDCIALPGGNIEETRCDGAGQSPPEYRVAALVDNTTLCPPETTDPIELAPSFGQRPYNVICGIAT
ncbi:MAG: hypothetical protein M3291_04905 [Actinomycetota bacterium]|nr:hypothetical protein [Actinomycetota bacterium]MDQ4020646.1 hypothetical protein [Actinomycetota bacterium]